MHFIAATKTLENSGYVLFYFFEEIYIFSFNNKVRKKKKITTSVLGKIQFVNITHSDKRI